MAVVLTLLEVLNPKGSIRAFIEPFVFGKIKCDFFLQVQYLCIHLHIVLVHKLYLALFAHKITVFKEQNEQNMNFTHRQEHQKYLLLNP